MLKEHGIVNNYGDFSEPCHNFLLKDAIFVSQPDIKFVTLSRKAKEIGNTFLYFVHVP